MANTFTLDSVRKEAENKYAPVVIELSDDTSVELRPLVRIGGNDRKVILKTLDEIGDIAEGTESEDEESDSDVDELAEMMVSEIQKIFRLICNKPKKLFDALDHDDSRVQAEMYTSVLMRWTGSTQLGEAASSPS